MLEAPADNEQSRKQDSRRDGDNMKPTGQSQQSPRLPRCECDERAKGQPVHTGPRSAHSQQLVSEKAKLRVWSRQMTAVAVAPLKRDLTAECLQTHSLGVLAADTIARQVGAVQEWPVDERVFRIVAAITTSVAAAVFARLLLTRIGL